MTDVDVKDLATAVTKELMLIVDSVRDKQYEKKKFRNMIKEWMPAAGSVLSMFAQCFATPHFVFYLAKHDLSYWITVSQPGVYATPYRSDSGRPSGVH